MISGTFLLRVSFRPISQNRARDFRERVSGYFSSIDPNFSLNQKQFAGFQYVFTWTGIPLGLAFSQRLLSFLKDDTKNYLSTWKTTLTINLIEKGF